MALSLAMAALAGCGTDPEQTPPLDPPSAGPDAGPGVGGAGGAGGTGAADAGCSDCKAPRCGDGTLDPGEICDDGNTAGGDGCSSDCRSDETCGNGYLDSATGEACDDGNADDGDGCQSDCARPTCGDGIVDPKEACDDGNRESGDGCSATCFSAEVCGNGVVDREVGEICDDGDTRSGDRCASDCRSDETCGNGVLDTAVGEACDDGNRVGEDGCEANCALPACGDGTHDVGEACDDGNNVDGDGCSATCMSDETCGNDVVDAIAGEVCDDGDVVGGDGCSADCRSEEICGNGILDALAGEVCDDGDTADGDGCSANCLSQEYCGNGVIDTAVGEVCDDDNVLGADGCAPDCRSDETCGNDVVDTHVGEACDDGNVIGGDGCSSLCTYEGLAGFRCSPSYYGTGDGCDCGCGTPDPDCVDSLRASCDHCGSCGSCFGVDALDNSACKTVTCGDGEVDPPEECDDGDTQPGDGCSADCKKELPVGWACSSLWYGDGQCDCTCGARDSDCTLTECNPVCGDGVVDGVEECDDGGNDPGDGCDGSCIKEVPVGWSCPTRDYDDGFCHCTCGAADSTADCTPSWCAPVCGDGLRENLEECDDGDNDPGDGCAPNCTWEIPTSWSCEDAAYGLNEICDCGCGAVDVDCESPSAQYCEDCTTCGGCGLVEVDDSATCKPPLCGNSALEPGEECDDGNTDDGDGCAGNCTSEVPLGWTCLYRYYDRDDGCDCGCGIVDPDCPNGAPASCIHCDACGGCDQVLPGDNSQCVPQVCGDGAVTGTEACDDGNTAADDGCAPDCTFEGPPGWYCAVSRYGSADGCDCGCGIVDPDCADASVASCNDCTACGGCTGVVPDANAQCL